MLKNQLDWTRIVYFKLYPIFESVSFLLIQTLPQCLFEQKKAIFLANDFKLLQSNTMGRKQSASSK